MTFIAELQRRRDAKDYALTGGAASAVDVDQFLSDLLASPDWAYNHFRVWLHRLVSDWRRELLTPSGATFQDAPHNEFAILLWLWLLCEFVRTDGTFESVDVGDQPVVGSVRLADFEAFVDANIERMCRDFQRFGWFCLLSVQDDAGDSESSTVEPASSSLSDAVCDDLFVSVPGTGDSSQSHSSQPPSQRSHASSNQFQHSITVPFQAQLAVLTTMLRSTFPYSYQFEMLVQMRRPRPQERRWQELPSSEHRLQLARRPYPQNAAAMVASEGEPLTPAEYLREFLLPLNMAEDIDDETFWANLFAEVET